MQFFKSNDCNIVQYTQTLLTIRIWGKDQAVSLVDDSFLIPCMPWFVQF